ncbi:hypothetical protein BAE44_0013794 [Dichanthelium oligosanthes]|uniref:Uncharacterized protein n=1 Tax=Dichanthelium oligosanthes TaxID=888268 RepID=A0A1E5VJB3_9POAL|nr:hypothetical protein BAE44_0013794 [Dichanthelium oligosanthes]
MKKPSTLLRSFSSRLSTRLAPSPAVAPWPPVRSAYDRWLAAELDELRADPLAPCTSATWLARALSVAVAAQRGLVASGAASGSGGASIDRKTIDECVEETAELLDACVGLQGRLGMLRSYVTAMRIALHWLEGHGGEAASRRAAAAFAECQAVERRCGAELAKCGSNLRKIGERALLNSKQPAGGHRSDEEALSGARALAFLTVGALGAALTFRPRRNMSGLASHAGGGKAVAQWECAFQEVQKQVREEFDRRRKEGVPCMGELDAAAAAARAVKCAVAGGQRCPETVLMAARRRCDELEDTVAAFEEKVGELHRELIGVRIVLLEWAQRTRGHELLRFDCTPWQGTPAHSEASCPRFSWSRKSDIN